MGGEAGVPGYGPEEQSWIPAREFLIHDLHSEHPEQPAPMP